MKKIVFLALVFLPLFISCKGKSGEEQTQNEVSGNFEEYKYKIIGLNDSIIADSVWKMIFRADGAIDGMVMNKEDSVIVIKVLAGKITQEQISNEITSRGAIIVQELN